MLDRIQELLQVRELSSSQFADAIGVSRPVVSHILSGRNKPSLEVVQKIIAAFPELSLTWLLNGDGPMLEQAKAPSAVKAEGAPKLPAAPVQTLPPVAPAAEAPVAAVAPPIAVSVAPVATAEAKPLEAPKAAIEAPPRVPEAPIVPQAAPAGAELAQALAEPGKSIRRIVLFYQDGTFTDFRPE